MLGCFQLIVHSPFVHIDGITYNLTASLVNIVSLQSLFPWPVRLILRPDYTFPILDVCFKCQSSVLRVLWLASLEIVHEICIEFSSGEENCYSSIFRID